MARRSKPYITQFFNRDRVAFTTLSRVGHMTPQQFKKCDIADGRLKNYIRDGYVQKVETKQGTSYKVTPEGKELMAKNWGITKPYHPQSAQHDLGIANKYFSLSENERDTWKTETELRDQFSEKIEELRDQGEDTVADMYADMLNQGLISMPDASYTNESGIEIAYEVITNNYGQAELLAKESYVQIMNTEYETTRV